MRGKHLIWRVGATLGLLIIADYDIGGMIYVLGQLRST